MGAFKMIMNILKNCFDNDCTNKQFELSFEDIIQMIQNPIVTDNKQKVAYIFPFQLNPESDYKRSANNVLKLDVIMLDYDSGIEYDSVNLLFKKLNVTFFQYTSHSHQLKGKDKFRIILPLKQPMDKTIFTSPIWRKECTKLFGNYDENAFKISGFYGPSYPTHTNGKYYRCDYVINNNLFEFDESFVKVINSKINLEKFKQNRFRKKKKESNSFNSCYNHPTVKSYLNTTYNKRTGNGDSNANLFNALFITVVNNDELTKEKIIQKAKNEGWSDSEIRHKIKYINQYIN